MYLIRDVYSTTTVVKQGDGATLSETLLRITYASLAFDLGVPMLSIGWLNVLKLL